MSFPSYTELDIQVATLTRRLDELTRERDILLDTIIELTRDKGGIDFRIKFLKALDDKVAALTK